MTKTFFAHPSSTSMDHQVPNSEFYVYVCKCVHMHVYVHVCLGQRTTLDVIPCVLSIIFIFETGCYTGLLLAKSMRLASQQVPGILILCLPRAEITRMYISR